MRNKEFQTFSAFLSTTMMLITTKKHSIAEAALAIQVDQSWSRPLWSFLREIFMKIMKRI